MKNVKYSREIISYIYHSNILGNNQKPKYRMFLKKEPYDEFQFIVRILK
jgi:hypothetical protein